MPHLDPAKRVMREYAAKQSREARIAADREANMAAIRDAIESGAAGIGRRPKSVHCHHCGSPFGDHAKDNLCATCQRSDPDWEDWAKDKLGPEEIHPESFPDTSNE